jgi:hypothetical protein
VQHIKLSEIFSVPYLGFMPEREASLPRGELSLLTGFQSIRGFRTGDMTEIVWPRSLLKANGGRAEGSGR